MDPKYEIVLQLSEIQYQLLLRAAEDTSTFMEQNQKALSEYTRQKFGEIYSPLVEGDIMNNAGKILINLFSYSVMNGLDLVPSIDREELISMKTEIEEPKNDLKKIIEVIKTLSPEQKTEILNLIQ